MDVALGDAISAARALLSVQHQHQHQHPSPTGDAQRAARLLHAALDGADDRALAAAPLREPLRGVNQLISELADAATPQPAREPGLVAPVGVAAIFALLGSLVRLLLALPACAAQSRHLADARRASARGVCAGLAYIGSDWAWSDIALQSEATALLAAVGRALVSVVGVGLNDAPPSEHAALSAAVFDQPTEVANSLQRLPVAAASAASCRVARLATAETAGAAMAMVPMMVPTIESAEWSLKLDGLLSVHHIVHVATAAEINWQRHALTGILLRALVFWEEDALSLSVPAAVRAMTAIHALHGGASSSEGAASLDACERLTVELIRALGLVENDQQRQIILKGLGELVESTHLMMTQFLPVSLRRSPVDCSCGHSFLTRQ
jgi:hypothetical protein